MKFYSVQKIPEENLDEIIFGHFVYINEQYEKDKKLIPEGNLFEISYEELKSDPFRVIQAIYSGMDLPDFELTADNLRLQLEMEKNYRNFEYTFSDGTLKKIEERWGKYIQQWNYKSA